MDDLASSPEAAHPVTGVSPDSLLESPRPCSRSRSDSPHPRQRSLLEDMPTELSHQICTELTFKDLQNLRLTSRTMDDKVTFTMKAEHRAKITSIRLLFVPSEICALEKFAECPLSTEVTTLQLLRTDFKTYVDDVQNSSRSNGKTSPAAIETERLYYETKEWASQPLHTILPNLSLCRLVYRDSFKAFGLPATEFSELMPSDFTLLGPLLGGFKRRVKAAVNVNDLFTCKVTLGNSPTLQVWDGSDPGFDYNTLTCRYHSDPCKTHEMPCKECGIHQIKQDLLRSCCRNIETYLLQRPIQKFVVFNVAFQLRDLQRLFETITPPDELHLRGGLLDFEEKQWERGEPIANTEAIQNFVASVRPNLRKLSFRPRLLKSNGPSSWVCLFEALKTCDSLESIAFDPGRNDNLPLKLISGPSQDGWETSRAIFRGMFGRDGGSEKVEAMVHEIGVQETLVRLIHCFRFHVQWVCQ